MEDDRPMTDPAPTTAPRVLVLDDEPIILMDLGFALEDAARPMRRSST